MSETDLFIDKASDLRTEDAFDIDAITAFLKQHIPQLDGIPAVKQFRGGASNLTYQLDFESQSFIMRCPPSGTKAKSAHDMGREFLIMKQLKPFYPQVPDMIVFCSDLSVIGKEFYIMEKLTGIIPRANLPKGLALNEEQAKKLCVNLIDKLVELHQVDYKKAGLESIGKGEGYVQRQISGWTDRYVKARTDNVPTCERVMQWLIENQPNDIATCVIHNDFRLDNVVLNPNRPTEIIGVLDWEMSTLGDPLMDLGNSLAYWIEANDPPPMQILRRQPTHLPGMMTRHEVVAYYCSKMGFENIDFTFYRVYGLFRLAVIAQQIYYRFHHGQTTNPMFADFHLMVTFLDNYCNELLDEIS